MYDYNVQNNNYGAIYIKMIKYLDKFLFINKKKVNIHDTIIILGTPRSGTTWLMEILETIPEYTYLFEPISPIYSTEAFDVGFTSRTYRPYDVEWPEGEKFLKDIFSGHKFGFLSSYKIKPEIMMRRLLGKKLIVKFIRLNRLLPWIAKRFQLRGTFFIIRHPCAVVASQLKTDVFGYHPKSPPYTGIFPPIEYVLDEASKIKGLNPVLINKLKKIKTKEEILAAVWCLDNYVPLSFPKPYPWTTIVYEKLILDGRNELANIFNKINEKVPKSAFNLLREPSMLTMKNDLKVVDNIEEQLGKWKKILSEKQVERILSIVSDFGLDFYTKSIEPDYENIGVKI